MSVTNLVIVTNMTGGSIEWKYIAHVTVDVADFTDRCTVVQRGRRFLMIYTILPPCLGALNQAIVGCGKGGVVQEPWQNGQNKYILDKVTNQMSGKIVCGYNDSYSLSLK